MTVTVTLNAIPLSDLHKKCDLARTPDTDVGTGSKRAYSLIKKYQVLVALAANGFVKQ